MEVWSQEMMRRHIMEFGNWKYCEEMPIARYLEYASRAGSIQNSFFGEKDRFDIPVAMPVKPLHQYSDHCRRKVRKTSRVGTEQHYSTEQQKKKQGTVCNATACTTRRPRAPPMAVDEDLYKIPPELLYQNTKRKRRLRKLLSGCMGLDCVS